MRYVEHGLGFGDELRGIDAGEERAVVILIGHGPRVLLVAELRQRLLDGDVQAAMLLDPFGDHQRLVDLVGEAERESQVRGGGSGLQRGVYLLLRLGQEGFRIRRAERAEVGAAVRVPRQEIGRFGRERLDLAWSATASGRRFAVINGPYSWDVRYWVRAASVGPPSVVTPKIKGTASTRNWSGLVARRASK